MASFSRLHKYTTTESLLKVDAGLPVGTYVFQLEVEDQNGNRSKAATATLKIVKVRDPIRLGDDDRIIVSPVVIRPRIP